MSRLHVSVPQGGRIDVEYLENQIEKIEDQSTRRIMPNHFVEE